MQGPMQEAWQVLARNYARFDTPLRPNRETLAALRRLIDGHDPLVAVLGATPLFSELAERVWFIDASADALRLVDSSDGQRLVHKDWTNASAELAQADFIVGDGSINAVSGPEAAANLMRALHTALQPDATLAMRVFLQHALPRDTVLERLRTAFAHKRFSEVRFLVYGLIAGHDGLTAIADIDRFITDLPKHIEADARTAARYMSDYFEWRGMSPEAATAIPTTAYFPARETFESLLNDVGLRFHTVSAGRFALAEFTPIYVATR